MANTSAIWQQAADTQQKPYKKSLMKNVWKNFFKSQENGQLAKKDKTERTWGLGRKTIEEIGKGNQMTALFQYTRQCQLLFGTQYPQSTSLLISHWFGLDIPTQVLVLRWPCTVDRMLALLTNQPTTQVLVLRWPCMVDRITN